jgi:hypothetical protein
MDRKQKVSELHQIALGAAKKFFLAEAELLDILQKIDAARAYLDLGHPSLFDYAVKGLKLSESTALNFINVARKAMQVPALKQQIESGDLSVSKARKIVPVLTLQNQAEWIEKAKTLSSRQIEKEVARVMPQEATPERVRYVSETRANVSLGLNENALASVRRVQDLESQRLKRAVSIEEAIEAMSAAYLEKNDPMKKAQRHERRRLEKIQSEMEQKSDSAPNATSAPITQPGPSTQADHSDVTGHASRQPLSAAIEHEIQLRDQGQCTYQNAHGSRCNQTRWLHIHHVQPVSHGGKNSLENLVTLCSAHHRMTHAA